MEKRYGNIKSWFIIAPCITHRVSLKTEFSLISITQLVNWASRKVYENFVIIS